MAKHPKGGEAQAGLLSLFSLNAIGDSDDRTEGVQISRKADRDLDEIYVYTRKTFGPEQARKYTDELKVCCERIASFPGLGRDMDHFRPGISVTPCQSHKIFYRLERSNILMLRILHQRMDPKDRL